MRRTALDRDWTIVQDVHDNGEAVGLHRPDFAHPMGAAISPWRPLPRLGHLQVVLADQPWYGRALRGFNEHAWWYRIDFAAPAALGRLLRLRFDGVDDLATVWLNGERLGDHEGYADAFAFDIAAHARRDAPNTLIVRVAAPWDRVVTDEAPQNRVGGVVRDRIKGTYEHADGFVQRDVDPIGLHAPVWLESDDAVLSDAPTVRVDAGEPGGAACVAIAWDVVCAEAGDASLVVEIVDDASGAIVARGERAVRVGAGGDALAFEATIPAAKRWRTWDRGEPSLYRARLRLLRAGAVIARGERAFGVRRVDLVRGKDLCEARIDGERVFLRGTTYFPDVYVSRMDRGRWRRDLAQMVAHGCNAVRVHVHQQPDGFYDECDRLGVLVLQDFDLNWRFPTDAPFAARAETLLRRMVRRLAPHPSLLGWVCMNETPNTDAYLSLGRRLALAARAEDPTRPTIVNSWHVGDPESGDDHEYLGSLAGGAYQDMTRKSYALLSEFGVDAPSSPAALRDVPELAARLAPLAARTAELHDYQYRLLKFYMERLRIAKWAPCGGYFQFLWIDLCPQSFYGVVDHAGRAKCEGLGGGLRAFAEANRPVLAALEHGEGPAALWVVNDLPRALGSCRVAWTLALADGGVVAQGEHAVEVAADARVRVADAPWTVEAGRAYVVALTLRGPDGAVIARNRYDDAFRLQPRPEGYPHRLDHEIGCRLWDA